MSWTLYLDARPHPGWFNMAVDQALLDQAGATGEGAVRLYRWEPACLSFGRNEPAARRYDRRRISALGLDTVRRPTGGRAVWHAEELTYSVAAPCAAFGSLAESYRIIHETLAAGLGRLGVTALVAPRREVPALSAGACFGGAVGGELLAGGRKLAGSAQLRQGAAFLQHGSLLLGGSQRVVAEVSVGARAPSEETALDDLLGRPVTFEEAATALVPAFQGWSGRWREASSGPALDPLAARHADHFRDSDWTWRR